MSKRMLIPSDAELTHLYPDVDARDRVNHWIGDHIECTCGMMMHYAGNGLACCPKCFAEKEF